MSEAMLETVTREIQRGSELLAAADGDLERVHAGVQQANAAAIALHTALAEDLEVDAQLIAATEALIRATAATLPALQRAELDVLALATSAETEARSPLQPSSVRRLADARARSQTTVVDLSRSLARAYEKAFASMRS